MKFSIIVPVYNVEKYLKRCLDSIQNQTYDNFEVIIVNDGSPDHSQEIIDEYVKHDDRFLSYQKENGGLSDARNYGVKYATGDYLLFVDSDDYVSSDYLKMIHEKITQENNPDILRFGFSLIDEKEHKKTDLYAPVFTSQSGIKAFYSLSQDSYFVPAWLYAYRKDFFETNHFEYAKGKYHEDYGLTPYVILCASKVVSISDCLYYYIVRENSIMTSNDEEKLVKKMNDTLILYDNLKEEISMLDYLSKTEYKYVMSYLTNTLFSKGCLLSDASLEIFIEELKKRKVWNYLMDDTFFRKVKKYLVKHHLKFYIRKMLK